jgi:NAD kinase
MVEKLNRAAKPNRLAQRVPGMARPREAYPQ